MPFDSYEKTSFEEVRSKWVFTGDKVKKLSRSRGGSIIDLVPKSDPVDTPTLVVSIGGLGGDTLNQIKKKFIERVKPQPTGQEKVLFVELDTDDNWMKNLRESVDSDSNIGFLTANEQVNIVSDTSPAVQQIVEIAQNNPTVPQHDWVDMNLPKDMLVSQAGAKGTRQMGRLSISAGNNYQFLRTKIQDKFKILQKTAPVRDGTSIVNVILIAGISGGTGSGSIIDTTYLLYLAAQDVGAIHIDIDAILYTPDVQENVNGVNKDNLKRNFTACMKEIDTFFKAKETGEDYRFKCHSFQDGKLRTSAGTIVGNSTSIFRSATLVQGYNAAGLVLDKSVPINTVSNYVVNLLCNMSDLRDNAGNPVTLIQSIFNNEGAAAAALMPILSNNPKLPKDTYYEYRTIGYHDVAFPVEEIMTVVANHVLMALHKFYQKEPSNSGKSILEQTGVFPIVDNCFFYGDDNASVVDSIKKRSNSIDQKWIKSNSENKIDSHINVSEYVYDTKWIDSAYDEITGAINSEFNNNGPYAALRLSQDICACLEVVLDNNVKTALLKDLEDSASRFKKAAVAAKNQIDRSGVLSKLFANDEIEKQVRIFKSSLQNYDVVKWEIFVFGHCINAICDLRNKLVAQHNDVFNRYVGAFLAINKILEKDSTGVVDAAYGGNVFSATLLNPSDLRSDNTRLYTIIKHCLKDEKIEKLSKSFIESMLQNRKSWTSTNSSDFNAVSEFKKIFDIYFTEFKQNIIQIFMVVKYTGEEYTNNNNVDVDNLLDVLYSYIEQKDQYPDPWGRFEEYCLTNYGIKPLHRAAEEILREATSVGYCAKEDDGMTNTGVSFDAFPNYKLLCLMKSTPDLNKIIEGDPVNNVPPLPQLQQWIHGAGTVARADISSVMCLKVFYKLPLYMFKGFSKDQEIYYNAVTSGNAHDAGLHMDNSSERPWRDFPQLIGCDGLRLLESSPAQAYNRPDYKFEISMLEDIKAKADYCRNDQNEMIGLRAPGDMYYTLYYIDDVNKVHMEQWKKNLISQFEADINTAIDGIEEVALEDSEKDWDRQFEENFAKKTLHQRLLDAQYILSERKLHEVCCQLGRAETDVGQFDDVENSSSGGFYKVIRRSTKSRMLLNETEKLCKELNDELEKIKNKIVTERRKALIDEAKKRAGEANTRKLARQHQEKLKLFFEGLLCKVITIEKDNIRKTITVKMHKSLVSAVGDALDPISTLRAMSLEKENYLYAVFTMFVYHKADQPEWWDRFKTVLGREFTEHADEFAEVYAKLNKEFIPTDLLYYPVDFYEANDNLKVINESYDNDLALAANPVFEHFGETKLTIDGLPEYRGAKRPYGYTIGSQLVKFYHDIKAYAKTYGIEE